MKEKKQKIENTIVKNKVNNSNEIAKNSTKMKVNKNGVTLVALVVTIIGIILITTLSQNSKKTKEEELNQNQSSSQESYVEEIEDGIKINKSTKLNEAKEIDGLQISNIQLTTEGGMTTLLADVTNNSGAKTPVKQIEITLVREDGSEIAKITGIINELEVGATTQLNISTTSDYVEAYDFLVSTK